MRNRARARRYFPTSISTFSLPAESPSVLPPSTPPFTAPLENDIAPDCSNGVPILALKNAAERWAGECACECECRPELRGYPLTLEEECELADDVVHTICCWSPSHVAPRTGFGHGAHVVRSRTERRRRSAFTHHRRRRFPLAFTFPPRPFHPPSVPPSTPFHPSHACLKRAPCDSTSIPHPSSHSAAGSGSSAASAPFPPLPAFPPFSFAAPASTALSHRAKWRSEKKG
ncbi:hypothetical protein B0H16DRAFT_1728301 [Mycena metata]|uniref:Uncharacterized protein n=1 Tax=Mycena metata TaxID=1033252 RepID=A0AAD7IFR7_9AGAR|nr:hypothetical protein B0H16DRAFT_1728301 [Mycena metata]